MIDEIICEECGVEIDGFFLCDDCEEELFKKIIKKKSLTFTNSICIL